MSKYLILRSDYSNAGYFPSALGGNAVEQEWHAETVDGTDAFAAELREDPRNRVVIDAEILLAGVRPESDDDSPDGIEMIGADRVPRGVCAVGAHTSPFTGQGVTVAVLDTGIDVDHPVFRNKTLLMYNFTDDGGPDDCRDTDGHGTHCAGTICGGTFAGIRVGVAPGVTQLCVGKVLGASGATVETLLKGLLWAVIEHKADVVSLSLSYDLAGNTSRLIERGMSAREAANTVLRQQANLIHSLSTLRAFLESQKPNLMLVAASGNESRRPRFALDAGLPAAELFAVGAVGTDPSGDGWTVAPFSNGRARVVAPGVAILSAAAGGGWKAMTGTSMATPHVAGVAALWAEKAQREGVFEIPGTVPSFIVAHANRGRIVDAETSAIGSGMAQAPQN